MGVKTGAVMVMVAVPELVIVAGKKLATAGADKVVRIWNPADGKLLKEFAASDQPIVAIAWNPPLPSDTFTQQPPPAMPAEPVRCE